MANAEITTVSRIAESYHNVFFENCEALDKEYPQNASSAESTEARVCEECLSSQIKASRNISNVEELSEQLFFDRAALRQKENLSCDLEELTDLFPMSSEAYQSLDYLNLSKESKRVLSKKKPYAESKSKTLSDATYPILHQLENILPNLKNYKKIREEVSLSRGGSEFSGMADKCIIGKLPNYKVRNKKYVKAEKCISRLQIEREYQSMRRSLWKSEDPVMSSYIDQLMDAPTDKLNAKEFSNPASSLFFGRTLHKLQESRVSALRDLRKQARGYTDQFKKDVVQGPDYADLILDYQEAAPGENFSGLSCSLQGRYGTAREHVYWAGQAAITLGSFGAGAGISALSAAYRLNKIRKTAAMVLGLGAVDLTAAYYSDCVGDSGIKARMQSSKDRKKSKTCSATASSVLAEVNDSSCALSIAMTSMGFAAPEIIKLTKYLKGKKFNSMKQGFIETTYRGMPASLMKIGDQHYVSPYGQGEGHRGIVIKISKEEYDQMASSGRSLSAIDLGNGPTRRLQTSRSFSSYGDSPQFYSALDPRAKPKPGDSISVKKIRQNDDYSMKIEPRNELLKQKSFHRDSEGNQYYEMISPIGERIYLKWPKGSDIMSVVKRTDTPFPEELAELKKIPLFTLKKASRITARNLDKKATKLSYNQLTKYSRLERGRKAIRLKEANKYMLNIVREKKELRLSDLKRLNQLANDEGTEYAGVVRGSRDDASLKGQEMGFNNFDVGAGEKLTYVPHQAVPRELNRLLDRINRINPNSDISEIAENYQEFILIHPFADGNGRTSRVLLDYMFQRAGVEPPVQPADGNILYQTPGELAEDLLERFD